MKNYAKWLIILLCGATFLGGCDSTKEKDKQDQTIESDANDREEDSENQSRLSAFSRARKQLRARTVSVPTDRSSSSRLRMVMSKESSIVRHR